MSLNTTQIYALEMSHTDYIANLLITHVEAELDRLEAA